MVSKESIERIRKLEKATFNVINNIKNIGWNVTGIRFGSEEKIDRVFPCYTLRRLENSDTRLELKHIKIGRENIDPEDFIGCKGAVRAREGTKFLKIGMKTPEMYMACKQFGEMIHAFTYEYGVDFRDHFFSMIFGIDRFMVSAENNVLSGAILKSYLFPEEIVEIINGHGIKMSEIIGYLSTLRIVLPKLSIGLDNINRFDRTVNFLGRELDLRNIDDKSGFWIRSSIEDLYKYILVRLDYSGLGCVYVDNGTFVIQVDEKFDLEKNAILLDRIFTFKIRGAFYKFNYHIEKIIDFSTLYF
jgi:hypothetical protein